MIEPDPQDEWLGIKAWEICPKWLPDKNEKYVHLMEVAGSYAGA